MNVEDIPDLNPKVQDYLMICLCREVTAYIRTVQGTKCHLCPFRRFSRLGYLKVHLKHHCPKNMYLADLRSPQRSVVRAYFDYCQAIAHIGNVKPQNLDLLKYSASIMEEWNSKCSESTMLCLHKQNRPVLVRVLTHIGPQY